MSRVTFASHSTSVASQWNSDGLLRAIATVGDGEEAHIYGMKGDSDHVSIYNTAQFEVLGSTSFP